MNKILATIKKISSAKLYFFKPKKVDILIWGVPLFIEILKEKKYNLDFRKIGFIHIWGESYNLNILLRCIIKFKFSFLEYTNEYIKHTRPKIILSFLDNYKSFYKIKKNENQNKILIQNAWRCDEFNIFKKDKSNFKYKVDFIFAQNEAIKKKFYEISKAKVIPIGSFLSNDIEIKKNKKKFDVLYISTFRNTENKNKTINKNIKLQDHIKSEANLIKNINNLCKKYNKKLYILTTQKIYQQKEEFNFFKKLLGKEKNCVFIKRNSYDYKSAYKIVDQAKVAIGIDTTLLYESFSRGIKTIFCDVRPKNKFLEKRRHFAWPKKYPKNGPFWLSDNKYSAIDKVF